MPRTTFDEVNGDGDQSEQCISIKQMALYPYQKKNGYKRD